MSPGSKPERPPAGIPSGTLCGPSTRVRMRMSLDEAQRIREELLGLRGSPAARAIHDALWLRVVLLDHCHRLGAADRTRFERRANRLLSRVLADPQSEFLSGSTITVGRDGKR